MDDSNECVPGLQVETLARTVLQAPVEIQVGGRSTVNADITQLVEIREEDDRFLRLLEVRTLSKAHFV